MIDGGNTTFNAVSWVDDAVHLHVDHDEAWMQRFVGRSPWELNSDDLIKDFPVAIFFPSKDSLKQAMFVAALRTFLDRSAPNLVRWDVIDYKQIEFVKATAAESTPIGVPHLYYLTLPDGLTASFNENVIRRAIDRHLKRNENTDSVDSKKAANQQETAPQSQLQTLITGTGANVLSGLSYRSGLNRMHRLSWGNLPILNDLRHRYPDRDPAEVYHQLFGQTLVEPSGGQYF